MSTFRSALAVCIAIPTLSFSVSAHAAPETLDVMLKGPSGQALGSVRLTALKHGVKIELREVKLPPGKHAIHFHEIGSCKGPDFKSAGSHYSVGKTVHGFDMAEGHHAGDMPNIIVPLSGVVSAELLNTEVTLDASETSLRKKGGTALVIHATEDDYKSQPAGNAGDRIACAEIK